MNALECEIHCDTYDSRHETTAVEAAATATGRCGGSTVAFEAAGADCTPVWMLFLTKVPSYIGWPSISTKILHFNIFERNKKSTLSGLKTHEAECV